MAAMDVDERMEAQGWTTEQDEGGAMADGIGKDGVTKGGGVFQYERNTTACGQADPRACVGAMLSGQGAQRGQGGRGDASADESAESDGGGGERRSNAEPQDSPAAARTDVVPIQEKVGLIEDVQEFWCFKSTVGYPKTAAEAASAVAQVLDTEWLRTKHIRGPPMATTYTVRNGFQDKAKAVATGLVEVVRDKFDGWQAASLPRIEATAWRVWSGIDHCSSVKAFGRSSSFAREINWVYSAIQKYLEVEGHQLSVRASEVAIGYTELRANQALDSGDGWKAGPIYGVNVPLEELEEVVAWATKEHKDGGLKELGDLELKWDGQRAASTSDEACFFRSSRSLVGSVTTYVQSQLSLGDFEIDGADGAPGVALIRRKFGEDYICKVIPSCPRGMSDKGIVKVRLLCELRFEKWLRSVNAKLVHASRNEHGGAHSIMIGDRQYDVKFLSLQTANDMVEAGEAARKGGGRGVLEPALRELHAENAKAVAKLSEVMEQIESLTDTQRMAQLNNEKNLAELAAAQREATVATQARIQEVALTSQRQIQELAENQAQAIADTQDLLAENAAATSRNISSACRDAINYSSVIHQRTQENLDKLTLTLSSFVSGQAGVAQIGGAAPRPCLQGETTEERSVLPRIIMRGKGEAGEGSGYGLLNFCQDGVSLSCAEPLPVVREQWYEQRLSVSRSRGGGSLVGLWTGRVVGEVKAATTDAASSIEEGGAPEGRIVARDPGHAVFPVGWGYDQGESLFVGWSCGLGGHQKVGNETNFSNRSYAQDRRVSVSKGGASLVLVWILLFGGFHGGSTESVLKGRQVSNGKGLVAGWKGRSRGVPVVGAEPDPELAPLRGGARAEQYLPAIVGLTNVGLAFHNDSRFTPVGRKSRGGRGVPSWGQVQQGENEPLDTLSKGDSPMVMQEDTMWEGTDLLERNCGGSEKGASEVGVLHGKNASSHPISGLKRGYLRLVLRGSVQAGGGRVESAGSPASSGGCSRRGGGLHWERAGHGCGGRGSGLVRVATQAGWLQTAGPEPPSQVFQAEGSMAYSFARQSGREMACVHGGIEGERETSFRAFIRSGGVDVRCGSFTIAVQGSASKGGKGSGQNTQADLGAARRCRASRREGGILEGLLPKQGISCPNSSAYGYAVRKAALNHAKRAMWNSRVHAAVTSMDWQRHVSGQPSKAGTGVHAHVQPLLPSGGGHSRQSGEIEGSPSGVSGLGFHHGGAGSSSPPHTSWSQGGARPQGLCYRWSSGACRGRSPSVTGGADLRRAAGGEGRSGEPGQVCVAIFGYGSGCGSDDGHFWATVAVCACLRGSVLGAKCLTCGLGAKNSALHHRFSARIHARNFKSGARGCRCIVLQLEVRAVVDGTAFASPVCSASGDARACDGRDSGGNGSGNLWQAKGYSDGMCSEHYAQMLCQTVEYYSGHGFAASRVGVVSAVSLSSKGFGRGVAKKEALGSRPTSSFRRLCNGSLMFGLLAGLCWRMLVRRRAYWRRRGRCPFAAALHWKTTSLWCLQDVNRGASKGCRRLTAYSTAWGCAGGPTAEGNGLSEQGLPRDGARSSSCGGGSGGRDQGSGARESGIQDKVGSREADGAGFQPRARPACVFVGRVLFWNARQLLVGRNKDRGAVAPEERMAVHKLSFLDQYIKFYDPWLVAVIEVSGDRDRMVAFRWWFKQRGYGVVFQVGEGSSRGQGSGGTMPTNGMMVAYRKGLQMVAVQRLAFRTVAVSVRHIESDAVVHVALMHGASGEGTGGVQERDESRAFREQLEEAERWCRERHGVLLADANRIPCAKWRCPGQTRDNALSAGDRALRRLVGWSCACCGGALTSGETAHGLLIGRQVDEIGVPCWTRWGSDCKARLDVGIAFGEAQASWRDCMIVKPELRSAEGRLMVSDHALIAYHVQLTSKSDVLIGDARPLPVQLGPRPRADSAAATPSPWQRMREITEGFSFRTEMAQAINHAVSAGSSQVDVLTALIRRTGELAVSQANAVRPGLQVRRRGGGRGEVKSELRSWEKRLRVAESARSGDGTVSRQGWMTLFHPRTRLRMLCTDARTASLCVTNWEPLVGKCRKMVRRAREALKKAEGKQDRGLVEGCASIDDKLGEGVAAHSDIGKIWRLVRDRKPNVKMQELHRGDDKDAPKIRFDDADFLFEAGRIGEGFVRAMDKGTVAQAFTAWLRTFSCAHDEIKGEDGPWSLRNEFTYAIYEKVLKAMTGKAVGAGGLSVELLLAASDEVRRLFYEAILYDVEQGCIARHWKRILYVLLPKPRPNDPAIISQRREIALAPQDLKLLLQGLRWTAFARVCERLAPEQYGWRAGASCTDPSLALGCALNQAKRLGHQAWVLYIDLANFFPAINREIACMGELYLGLPARVADIMGSIYGGQRGCAEFVECQYETAAGLGAPFRNHVGRLMGCPVSPDSAKILLDSVLRAIKRSVRGMQLWPFEGAELTQLAFADDWCGVFDDLGELKKSLTIWITWIQVVGAALGIKGLVKTVVSGVEFKEGRALSPLNPRLTDAEGSDIPFISCDQLYKHLGIPRSCDSMGSRAWHGGKGVLGIKDKLRAVLRRLRRVRPGSMSLDEFMMVSNVLLGCTAGFYLSACVASADELEQIEVEWRKIFNRFAGRDASEPVSELYAPALRWTKGRVHLRCVGSAAIFAAVEKAMTDVRPSPASLAVRSAVALSLYQHGCRSDPNRWSWLHLRETLERDLRGKGPRYLGDAWMLAALEVEEARDPAGVWSDRAEEMRGAAWGRWKGLSSAPSELQVPLRSSTAWFCSRSITLFDPAAVGGLGLAPCRHLLAAGVHELHDLCTWPLKGASDGGSWLWDKRAVSERFRIRISKGWWREWEGVLLHLQRAGVRPVCLGCNVGRQWRRYPARNRTGLVRSSTLRGLRSMRDRWSGLVRGLRRARLAKDDSTPAEVWQRRLETAFPRVHEEAGTETVDDSSVSTRRGRSLVVWCLSRDGTEEVPQWGDFSPSVLPVTRWPAWQDAGRYLRQRVRFREGDGWPLDGSSGKELAGTEVSTLPPGPQLLIRARIGLGKGATVRARGFGEKLKGIRVALDVQQQVWDRVCDLQARFRFTHAFTGDASCGEGHDDEGKVLRDDAGWPEMRVSAASISDSGNIAGGLLPVRIPYTNYAGEIVALLLALKASPDGARVLIVFDASSPLLAWAKFRKVSPRTQGGYQEAELLAELDRHLQRMGTVYLLWLSSHCGAPVNEWADVEAERLREQGETLDWLPLAAPQCFAMWPAKATGPMYRWAVGACRRSLTARFARRASPMPCREDTDWDLGLLPEACGVLAGWTRCEKLMVGDAGHKEGQAVRRRHRDGCVAGCPGGSSCWQHYLFACAHPLLLQARAAVRQWIDQHQRAFDCLGLHKQIIALRSCLNPRQASTARGLDDDRTTAARRVFCGFVRRDPCDIGSTVRIAKNAVRELVVRCCGVARVAFSLEEPLREVVTQEIREQAHLRRALKEWSSLHLRAGPIRVAAMRNTGITAQMVRGAASWGLRSGRLSRDEAVRLRASGVRMCKAVRVEVRTQWPLLEVDAARLLWFLSMKLWGRMVRREKGVFIPSQLRATTAMAAAWRMMFRWFPELVELKGSKRDLWWRMGEVSPSTPSAEGWVLIPGVTTRHRAACRGFFRLGGYPKLRGTLRRLRYAAAAARLERLREWMRSWLQKGSCSGNSLKSIREEERIVLDLPPRKKARVALRERAVAQGAAADARGRWAVRDILRARRQIGLPRRCRGVSGWEALVDWCGQDPPSWVPYLHLNKTLRLRAKELIDALSGHELEKHRRGREPEGATRKRKRTAGPAPAGSMGVGRRLSPRVIEAAQKRAKLQSALVIYVPPQERAEARRPKGFHAVAELTERLIIGNEPFVRVRWKHPAPGDPELVHFAWLSVDLQDALLKAASEGSASLVVDESLA